MPVFIANGYYKHKTDFVSQHVIYRANRNFRQVDRYVNTRKLIRQRDELLITMDFHRQTVHHDEHVLVEYDRILYRDVVKNRWNPYTNKPIKNASELCSVIRKIVNSDPSRLEAALSIARKHDRVIVFYTFDYERDILLSADWGDKTIAEWSGHTHQDIPDTDKWVYLSQYLSGAEGWNCIQTDTIIFYSQSYSYRQTEQAKGRIDRLNTKYIDLWYYYLKSVSPIDTAISVALKSKKKFNEEKFVGKIKF